MNNPCNGGKVKVGHADCLKCHAYEICANAVEPDGRTRSLRESEMSVQRAEERLWPRKMGQIHLQESEMEV